MNKDTSIYHLLAAVYFIVDGENGREDTDPSFAPLFSPR
jgi:hypothetical protein